MLRFSSRQWRAFNCIRRKHKVSLEFLQYNLPKILKYIAYGLRLRIVLKCCVIRKQQSVVLKYNKLFRLTFDDDLMSLKQRKLAKRRNRILKQWSKSMVQHLRNVIGVTEFEEVLPKRKMPAKDVINEMKKQLELLKAGKRSKLLIEDIVGDANVVATKEIIEEKVDKSVELTCEKSSIVEEKVVKSDELACENSTTAEEEVVKSVELACENFATPEEEVAKSVELACEKSSIAEEEVVKFSEIACENSAIADEKLAKSVELPCEKSPIAAENVVKSVELPCEKSSIAEEKVAKSVELACEKSSIAEHLDANKNEQKLVLNEKTGVLEQIPAAVVVDLATSTVEDERIQEIETTNSVKAVKNDVVDEAGYFETVFLDEIRITKETESISEEQINKVFKDAVAPKSTVDILHEKTEHQEEIPLEAISKVVSPPKRSANILDVLMQKVFAPKTIENKNENEILQKPNISAENVLETDPDADSSEEFLGFADDERLPGMLRTPLVRYGRDENSAFISQSLDEYFRANALDTSVDVAQLTKVSINRKVRQTNIEGLMTLNCQPPALLMPALPEQLLKLRTVAERRQFLQKSTRNSKLAIINNEASIYRELQRKLRNPRIRCPTQQALQTAFTTQMSFTRLGWQAASFINTEVNKYYFQKLLIMESSTKECVTLRGVFGNNTEKFKSTYTSRPSKDHQRKCSNGCVDCYMAPFLKSQQTFASKKKLNIEPLRPLFKPCPLSYKPKQQFLDKEAVQKDDMTVVRLPTIELLVAPELGKSFNEIAKRYLQLIAPFNSISREWAEFSVSTLQEPSSLSSLKENKVQKPATPKTYNFTIPYANDRSQILVRRVVHREENIDPFFQSSPNEPRWSGLNFRDGIDTNDEIAMECADVLTDMINSVALSCCEDSFIKDDLTENISTKLKTQNVVTKFKSRAPIKVAISQKTSPVHNKKSRLINELRRLNATIINTQSQPKTEERKCPEEFCALGCVCGSLANGKGSNQHCEKLKCMFHCHCSTSNISQIVRLESDGRSITTEDAVMMRRQATARLARMEKEFTSTIVVTENETLLINDSAYEKRRRAARLPKRFEDYHHTDEEFSRVSPVKSGLNESNEFRSPSTVLSDRSICEREPEPVRVKDVVLQKLKHCSVPLVPFDEIQNMAVFCLVHQLYKCSCGGRATEGKRFIIEKENSTTSKIEGNDFNLRSPKSRYSFERSEEPLSLSSAITSNSNHSVESANIDSGRHRMLPLTPRSHKSTAVSSNQRSLLKRSERFNSVECDSSTEFVGPPLKKAKISLDIAPLRGLREDGKQNILTSYFQQSEIFGCSRFVPVPSRTYRSRNNKRFEIVMNCIRTTEDRATQLLLNERILRSVYFHKEILKAENAQHQMQLADKNKKQWQQEHIQPRSIRKRKLDSTVPLPLSKQPKIEIECAEEDSMDVGEEEPQQSSLESQCYSLAKVGRPDGTSEDSSEPTASLSEEMESTFAKDDDSTMRENYNEVIKTLNGLVSRKMHDIDNALKRDSKVVPPPTEDILCVLRWRNFAEAYRENFIYVWEVKMKNRHFLAATVKNIIPIVPGALGVMNILAVPTERLPLIGRLLLLPFTYNESSSLAVIMQGRSQYWYIKGFLEPNGANACLRPTPETHPELTLKINTLCSSLIKQRAREQERVSTLQKQRKEKQQQQQVQAHQLGQAEMLKVVSATSPVSTNSKQVYLNTLKECIKTSNIAIRRVTPGDIATLKAPQIYSFDHRWFVLDWAPDFSHIFIPELRELISYEHISRLNETTALKNTVHRMEFYDKNHFSAYFVPGSKQKIYFGPFTRSQLTPVLVLMQKVNGEMMPREVYEKMRLLKPHAKATTAFWMTQINGKIYFDEAIKLGRPKNITLAQTKLPTIATTKAISESNTSEDDDDDDDDCVIIENEQCVTKAAKVACDSEIFIQKLADSPITTTTTTSTSVTKVAMQKPTDSSITLSSTKTSTAPKERMNFTIQTSATTNALKISTSNGFELYHTGTSTESSNAMDDEAKAKILSVFKLPPVGSTATLPTKTTLTDTVASKRHSLNIPDSTNANLQSNSLNKTLPSVDKSSTTYQQEFTKLANKPFQKSNFKVQVVQPLNNAVTQGTDTAVKNVLSKSRPLGNYKLYVTPAINNARTTKATTTTAAPIPVSTTATDTNVNKQSPQIQTSSTASNTTPKLTAVPINIMKATPVSIRTLQPESNQTKTVTTTTNLANTFSIQNLQRPITIKRIEKSAINSAGLQAITPTGKVHTLKGLSGGIIKLPTGIFRTARPIVAPNMQQTLSSIPAGLKIVKTSVTPNTSKPASQAVYPVNLVAASQSDVTTISFNTMSQQATKTVVQAPTSSTNSQTPATLNKDNSMSKTLNIEPARTTQPTTQLLTPAKAEFPASKFASSFLSKKTAAPSLKRPSPPQYSKSYIKNAMRRSLPEESMFKAGTGDLNKKPSTGTKSTPSPVKKQQLPTLSNQRPRLKQRPQKPPTKLSLPEFFADPDVILIDD